MNENKSIRTIKVKKNIRDRIFDVVNYFILGSILFIIIYPLYLIIISSVSDPYAVMRGEVLLHPIDTSFSGYKRILEYKQLWISYGNSILYTLFGTGLNIILTMMAAYALTQKFIGKSLINFIIIFTMFFSGGLIPTFLLVRNIGLYNKPIVMILMSAVSVWNLMVTRTYISTTIPTELYEAAKMDGASHFCYFFKMILPLSGTIIAVLSVYYGISHWNNYFTGLIYLRDRKYLPLQTILREILATLQVNTDMLAMMADDFENQAEIMRNAEIAKYCIIVVSTVPAVVLYVFMQKYFVKGVMIGSLKG